MNIRQVAILILYTVSVCLIVVFFMLLCLSRFVWNFVCFQFGGISIATIIFLLFPFDDEYNEKTKSDAFNLVDTHTNPRMQAACLHTSFDLFLYTTHYQKIRNENSIKIVSDACSRAHNCKPPPVYIHLSSFK